MPSSSEGILVGGSTMRLHLNAPDGPGPFPSIVVIHAGPGLNRFVQHITDRLVADGYATIAPDLYHRISDDMLSDGSRRINHLDDSELVADVNATVDFLQRSPNIDTERLGIVGFCLGGRVSWLAAATNSSFKGAVPYYGGSIMAPWGDVAQTPFDLTSQINCPMMFHFGEFDPNPSQAEMALLDAELTRLGKDHQFFTYPAAGHAFMDNTDSRYNAAADEASWQRTLEFFSAQVMGAAGGR